jgi:hypothetical protein
MQYGVALVSKYTGERTVLGSVFETSEDRQAYIDAEVCSRCFRTEIVYVHDGDVWINRHIGFAPRKQLEKT